MTIIAEMYITVTSGVRLSSPYWKKEFLFTIMCGALVIQHCRDNSEAVTSKLS